jgi:predicted nuclease with TOPRIM domain
MFQVAAPRNESELELVSPLRAGNGLTALQVAAVEDTFGAMNAAVTALQNEWELGRHEVQERLAETVGEKVRLRTEVEALKAEHAHMIDDMRQMRVSCTAALKEQQADKGAAWVRAVAANEALAASSQQMSALKSENTELREMLVGLARNLQQHRDASEAEGKERRSLERQLQKLEQQNADEALRFVDFDNSLDAALTECARHKARANAMDEKCAKYDAMEARCQRLGTENRRLESENVRLSTENARVIKESARIAQELAVYKQKAGQQALVQWAKENARSTAATPQSRQTSTSTQEQLLVQWAKANAPQYPKPRRIQVRSATQFLMPLHAIHRFDWHQVNPEPLRHRWLQQHKRFQQHQQPRLQFCFELQLRLRCQSPSRSPSRSPNQSHGLQQ